jgi:hypothetical protein
MSISSLSESSSVLAQQRLVQQSQATYSNPLAQGGDGFDMSSTVQPPGSSPPGPAATGDTATGAGASSFTQAGSVSQQLTKLRSYLLGLQSDTSPGSADNAALVGTASIVSPAGTATIVSNATSAAAASKYMTMSQSASRVVSSTMIC